MKPRSTSVLVLGAGGMLGCAVAYELDRLGYSVAGLDRSRFDVLNEPVTKLRVSEADYVVNAIGLINRREKTEAGNFRAINSHFPRELADYCAARSARLIHISTDCVYDGRAGPYTESDASTAQDLYGRSKAMGEPSNCLVLRTSVIGPERRHFYSLLTWFLSQTGACRGYRNHRWNGMTTIQFARVIHKIIENDLFTRGVRHVFSDDTTKLDLLLLLRETYQTSVDVLPYDDDRARDTRLRTNHPEFVQRLGIPDLRAQLSELPALSDALGRWRMEALAKFGLSPAA